MADQDEENLEAVEIGRPLIHDNVHYGQGTYRVDAQTAKALRAKGATAGVAETMRRERERRDAELRNSGESGEQGGRLAQTGAQTSTGAQSQGEQTGGAGAGDDGKNFTPTGTLEEKRAASEKVEALTGELPADFPARDKLEAAGITRYEQLTKLSREQIDEFPGIGAATVEQIGQRLFADALGK